MNNGASVFMSVVELAMIITVLLVIIGGIFNTEGSESVQDTISASAFGASSWMQAEKPKQRNTPVMIDLNFILFID